MNEHRPETREEAAARVQKQRDLSKIKYLPPREEKSLYNRLKKRVGIYCRVSTDGLSQVTSYNLQMKHYYKMAMSHPDWELVGIYSDEGISATSTAHRKGLLCLIEDVMDGMIDMVVTKSVSRLSRNLMDAMKIIFGFRNMRNPVGILFESENIYSLDRQMDFTLYVLALIAQEESRKKSEAMKSSYGARFADGLYMKPACLGFDRGGINELIINPEEAETVRLMYMMYNAGYTPEVIAETLMELGRKTHTHIYPDGHIKEGEVKWSPRGVVEYLKNERRCGEVLAQKSFTVDCFTHETRSNMMRDIGQFRAYDQHEPIVSPQTFHTTQRLILGNRGGWRRGIPELEILSGGALHGFVDSVPGWYGFDAEDYNRACLRAYGVKESALDALEDRLNEANKDEGIPVTEFQHVYKPKMSDFLEFDDFEEEEEEVKEEPESFGRWTEKLRTKLRSGEKANSALMKRLSTEIENGILTEESPQETKKCNYEVISGALCSTIGRSYATFDTKGVSFSKHCFDRMGGDPSYEYVKIAYNTVEKVIAVHLAPDPSDAKAVRWSKAKEGIVSMRRCLIRGLASAIYDNQDWNRDYKYKVFGTFLKTADGPVMLFSLENPTIMVKVKKEKRKNIDTSKEPKKKVIHDGFDPDMFEIFSEDAIGDQFKAAIDEFDIGNGPIATTAKQIARSRVTYYNDIFCTSDGNKVSIAEIGERKYDPEFIEQMLGKGMEPKEGWSYLEGLVIFRKDRKGFTMLPLDDPSSFGCAPVKRIKRSGGRSAGQAYGWTVGLSVPSKAEVCAEIEKLRA